MEVKNPCASGPLMEIVNILGYYCHIVVFLQSGYREMGGVRLGLRKLDPELVVESQDKLPVTVPSLYRRDLLAFRMTLLVFEIIVLEPVLEERIEDDRTLVVSLESEDLLLHQGVLEPADVGG